MATKQQSKEYYKTHKKQHKQWMDDWWGKHPDKKDYYRRQLKLKAMRLVSGQEVPACVYCGCDDLRFLEVNHKNGGGSKEYWHTRMTNPPPGQLTAGSNLYSAIIKGTRKTDDLEIVCRPHNALHYLKLKYGSDAALFLISWLPKSYVRSHTT